MSLEKDQGQSGYASTEYPPGKETSKQLNDLPLREDLVLDQQLVKLVHLPCPL